MPAISTKLVDCMVVLSFLTVCTTCRILPPFKVRLCVSGKVITLVFPLEEGALISKVPPQESAVNFIELMMLTPLLLLKKQDYQSR